MSASSLIGAFKTEVDTPALLVDLDVMEENIGRVAEICRTGGVGWRPHTKGQKTPEIIRKELAAGAIGVTCAKLGEAEVIAATGIRDILIANQIVGPAKMRRLVGLLTIADPIVGVDSAAHVDELTAALLGTGHTLRLVIEVDIGMHRAGVQPGPNARRAGSMDLAPAAHRKVPSPPSFLEGRQPTLRKALGFG
jgi:D-serine deaminase-like pyridoxal phosphate-dependent protein